MKHIAHLLFEARMLKNIARTGYPFLGVGKESVAEHSFSSTFIGYVMSRLDPSVNALKLISMCLVHDLPEARIGDLNHVQKRYVAADESSAVADATRDLPFGGDIAGLIDEFNAGETREARLAQDADQLSFVLELKSLSDLGYAPPDKWLQHVHQRMKTRIGIELSETIMRTGQDQWWYKNFIDSTGVKH